MFEFLLFSLLFLYLTSVGIVAKLEWDSSGRLSFRTAIMWPVDLYRSIREFGEKDEARRSQVDGPMNQEETTHADVRGSGRCGAESFFTLAKDGSYKFVR